MSTQTLGAVGSARGSGSLAEVLDPARAGAGRFHSVRSTARKDSGFQSVLAREATAASRTALASDRVARRQDAERDPEGARVIAQAVQSLLNRINDGTTTTATGQAKTNPTSPIDSLKASLQKLWLQGDGSRAVSDLASLALSGAAPAKTAATDAAGATPKASYTCPLGLDQKTGIDLLLNFLKGIGGASSSTTDTGTTGTTGGTDALASFKDQLKNLATVVMDAVQAYVNSKNTQPTPPPDLVYLAQSTPGADSAAGVRLVGLETGKEDVVSSLQTLVDRLQADAAPMGQRRGNAGAQGDTSALGQVLLNGPAAGAHASSATLAADAARAAATAQTAHATESVRQVQAAMADMLDRMRGNVAFDTDHMRAVIQLDPPALGRVHVALSVDDGQRVHATFHAEDASTRDFLQQNQSDLRREFERQGYASRNVEIVFDDDTVPGGFGAGGKGTKTFGVPLAPKILA